MPNDGWRSDNAKSKRLHRGNESRVGSQPDLREANMEEDRMARLANELARRDTSTTKHVDLKCQGVKISQCSYADMATVERMHM